MSFDFDEESPIYHLLNDSDLAGNLTSKVNSLAQDVRKLVIHTLINEFDQEDLQLLTFLYGEKLVYPILPDVEWLLSQPRPSDMVH